MLSMSYVTFNINVVTLDLVCNKHILDKQFVIHLKVREKALSDSYY